MLGTSFQINKWHFRHGELEKLLLELQRDFRGNSLTPVAVLSSLQCTHQNTYSPCLEKCSLPLNIFLPLMSTFWLKPWLWESHKEVCSLYLLIKYLKVMVILCPESSLRIVNCSDSNGSLNHYSDSVISNCLFPKHTSQTSKCLLKPQCPEQNAMLHGRAALSRQGRSSHLMVQMLCSL